ncbi:MAG TPA: FxsA family protein [Terrabacter sp.]|nr:FxsA family protein [Terrabacter sp.]
MTTAPRSPRTRRLRLTRLALVGLLLLPILEIVVIVAVGQWIGGWPTFLLIVATSLLGAWLIRREGGRAWRELQQAVRSGRMPAREIADGIVVLAGGTLLVLPGFITDVVGLLLVLPFTRPVARSLLAAVISRRLLAQTERFTGPRVTGPRVTGQPTGAGWQETDPQGPQRSSSSDEVVEGEIIDED